MVILTLKEPWILTILCLPETSWSISAQTGNGTHDLSVDYLPYTKQYLRSNKVKCVKLWEPESHKCDSWNVFDDSTREIDRTTNHSKDIAGLSDDEIASRIYRSYDISITYDRYYETPRIWLFGFNQLGLPITKDEMLTDIPTEYIGKTVTAERHPFTGRLNLTIHPCYQIDAMNKLYRGKEEYRYE
ncbi:conserved hypothetical protein [Theileria equi strain WA]|uniref:Uncharacterized protein n=1 Tax=Theileria equi strain WA TaxID=1537102 RepID=L1LC03_THEEQ|nr:conserved hypothetical protein [Theileria equi strain WA]EKX72977.1 conserved hypothetical protein [Theileria equi strain WA]|eukprot:XP_004832429.1 conserved hypothetical protein [Theileria equi strain WA]